MSTHFCQRPPALISQTHQSCTPMPLYLLCLVSLLGSGVLTTGTAYAESVFPINPQEYGMHKPFGPPKPITPNNVLTATPENQFDHTDRDNSTSAIRHLNERMDKKLHLTLGQYGDSTYTGALWRQREANYYLIASAAYTKAKDYEDGNGKAANYGYDRNSEALILGLLPTMQQEHRLTLIHDDINDDKQPQHVMDPSNTRRLIGKYNGRFGAADSSNTLFFELSAIDLARDANNFDLRNTPAAKPKITMDVERQKYATDLHYRFKSAPGHESTIGAGFKDDTHDAKRFITTPAGQVQNGYRFPDVNNQTWRLYAAHQWQLTPRQQLKGALSYDWQKSDPQGANQALGLKKLPSAAQLWKAYYGKNLNGTIDNDGLSGKLRYGFSPASQHTLYGELASLYRMPENPERFAVLPGPAGKGWASNPWIKPERDNRLTLGMTLNGNSWSGYQSSKDDNFANAWQINGALFYADIQDFITLDRYRGANAKLQGNVISRNVDATLKGLDFTYRQNWNQHLSSKLGASYRHGSNQTDSRPLYQISPFSANLSLDWLDYFDGGSYSLGSRVRYVHKQNRLDDNPLTGFGIDNAVDGFTTMDLYAGIEWHNTFGIGLGINNIFDRDYAEFITGNHVEAVAPQVVNAPGRTFWLRLSSTF